MKTFAARLRTAREAKGYGSAQQFAGVLGVEPHTYRKYERGHSEPNFDILLRICDLLDVDAAYLLPRPGQVPPKRKKNANGGDHTSLV